MYVTYYKALRSLLFRKSGQGIHFIVSYPWVILPAVTYERPQDKSVHFLFSLFVKLELFKKMTHGELLREMLLYTLVI